MRILKNYKCYIQHYRHNDRYSTPHLFKTHEIDGAPTNYGGATHVKLVDKTSNEEYNGYSFCNKSDPFVRKVGTTMALNRALIIAESNDPVEVYFAAMENNRANQMLNRRKVKTEE